MLNFKDNESYACSRACSRLCNCKHSAVECEVNTTSVTLQKVGIKCRFNNRSRQHGLG